MSRPGTRFFVGPLTPAQARRRMRARLHWTKVDDMAYTRNITVREALLLESDPDGFRIPRSELWREV